MPFELQFKLFLGDLSFAADEFELLIENNNKKIYEIDFIEHKNIIENIYNDNDMENDYTDDYNEFIIKMEDYLNDNDIDRLYVSVYDIIIDFTKYQYNKTIKMVINK